MQFGFSCVGLLYLVMLMVPNLLWTRSRPKDYAGYAAGENRVLLTLERLGEVLVTASALCFSDFNLRPFSFWSVWLLLSFLLMVVYELYWVRYFRSEKTMADFYSSFWGIPVAGATLPVAAFLLLAIYGKNPVLLLSVIVLGIGHIGIHLQHAREI